MTPEQRFDRLERIVKLMVKTGLRARKRMREFDEKIAIIIDSQLRSEERAAKYEQSWKEELTQSKQRWKEELGQSKRIWDARFAEAEQSWKEELAQSKRIWDARFAQADQRWEERFLQFELKQEERAVRYDARFAANEERFAKLAEYQLHTDRKLGELIEIVRRFA